MATLKALAGTRRASDRCGGCGHARIRHPRTGTLGCAAINYTSHFTIARGNVVDMTRCPCPGFTEPNGDETCLSSA